jgi:hypothetical protein
VYGFPVFGQTFGSDGPALAGSGFVGTPTGVSGLAKSRGVIDFGVFGVFATEELGLPCFDDEDFRFLGVVDPFLFFFVSSDISNLNMKNPKIFIPKNWKY